jgi:hypothetical protein
MELIERIQFIIAGSVCIGLSAFFIIKIIEYFSSWQYSGISQDILQIMIMFWIVVGAVSAVNLANERR